MNATTAATDDRKYVKRIRERMRRRGYLLWEQLDIESDTGARVWQWWWGDIISHTSQFGPYEDSKEACQDAESRVLSVTQTAFRFKVP